MSKHKNTSQPLLQHIIEGIEEVKGAQITVLNLSEIENVAFEYFVICEGTSNIQVQAIAESVRRHVSRAIKENPIHIEGTENALWILLDYVNVIVHVFQKHIREHYLIEELWGDAEVVDINKLKNTTSTMLS